MSITLVAKPGDYRMSCQVRLICILAKSQLSAKVSLSDIYLTICCVTGIDPFHLTHIGRKHPTTGNY